VRTFSLAHAVGFISSALFLVPGFPLVAALLDLVQHQTTAGIARLFYGVLLTLAAAFGLSIVAALARLAPAPARAARAVRGRAAAPGRALRPVHRRGAGRPRTGATGAGRSRHRADDPAVARRSL